MKKIMILILLVISAFSIELVYPGLNYLDDLQDVDARGAETGQLLEYQNGKWVLVDTVDYAANVADSTDVASWGYYNGQIVIDSMRMSQIVLNDGTENPKMTLYNYSNVGSYSGGEISWNVYYNGTNWVRQDTTHASYCIFFNADSCRYEFWIEPMSGDSIITWDAADYYFDTTGIVYANNYKINSITANYGDSILTLKDDGTIGYTLADSLGGGTTLLSYSENGTFANGQTANAPDCIVMGDDNSITNAYADYSVISGGGSNEISGYDDADNANYSTIGGGAYNRIINDSNNKECYYSTIGGGCNNLIQRDSDHSTISGGKDNTINADGFHTICGGGGNTISGSVTHSTIAGGLDNTCSGYTSLVGGHSNTCSGHRSFVAGIYNSTSGHRSFVFGNDVDISQDDLTAFYDSVNPGHFAINCDDSDSIDTDIALQVNGGVYFEDSLRVGSSGDFINGFYFAGDSLFIINGSDTMKFVED